LKITQLLRNIVLKFEHYPTQGAYLSPVIGCDVYFNSFICYRHVLSLLKVTFSQVFMEVAFSQAFMEVAFSQALMKVAFSQAL
jgi:hypothetical protein